MSEHSESITDEQNIEPISHRRILILMAAAVILGCVLSFALVSVSFGVGILIGGILSFLNYFWLKQSLKAIFEKAIRDGETPRYLGLKYFSRYAAFGLVLGLVYLTHTVSVVAVILGVSSLAVAITIEGFIRLFTSIIKK